MHVCVLAQYFIVAGHVQVPAMHGTPVAQTLPHEPQLFSSLTTSLQTPLHSFSPGRQFEATHVHVAVVESLARRAGIVAGGIALDLPWRAATLAVAGADHGFRAAEVPTTVDAAWVTDAFALL